LLDVETVFDKLETRCPRLGGSVPFDYCRKLEEGLPCSRALVCWEPHFPVARYLSSVLTKEEWGKTFKTDSQSRLEKIISIADQFREQDDIG